MLMFEMDNEFDFGMSDVSWNEMMVYIICAIFTKGWLYRNAFHDNVVYSVMVHNPGNYDKYTSFLAITIYIWLYQWCNKFVIKMRLINITICCFVFGWVVITKHIWNASQGQYIVCHSGKFMLTHWGRDKMDTISQTTLSNTFWKC